MVCSKHSSGDEREQGKVKLKDYWIIFVRIFVHNYVQTEKSF
jgi:hypothetical protein